MLDRESEEMNSEQRNVTRAKKIFPCEIGKMDRARKNVCRAIWKMSRVIRKASREGTEVMG